MKKIAIISLTILSVTNALAWRTAKIEKIRVLGFDPPQYELDYITVGQSCTYEAHGIKILGQRDLILGVAVGKVLGPCPKDIFPKLNTLVVYGEIGDADNRTIRTLDPGFQ